MAAVGGQRSRSVGKAHTGHRNRKPVVQYAKVGELFINEFNRCAVHNNFCGTLHNSGRSITNIYDCICAQLFSFCNHSFCCKCASVIHHFVISLEFSANECFKTLRNVFANVF